MREPEGEHPLLLVFMINFACILTRDGCQCPKQWWLQFLFYRKKGAMCCKWLSLLCFKAKPSCIWQWVWMPPAPASPWAFPPEHVTMQIGNKLFCPRTERLLRQKRSRKDPSPIRQRRHVVAATGYLASLLTGLLLMAPSPPGPWGMGLRCRWSLLGAGQPSPQSD